MYTAVYMCKWGNVIKTEKVNPNLKGFVKSFRDVGYTFEIAVADIIDNSITAQATTVEIYTVDKPDKILCMLDNGIGMDKDELVEAMRLASKDPDDERHSSDLGRFGLGLKTASFSQCKKLTVISKKNNIMTARQWDLDYISEQNEWLLLTPEDEYINQLPLVDKLRELDSGTLVVWESIDRLNELEFSDMIDTLRKHLSLVFHRFLDGSERFKRFSIIINNNPLKAFNPFNTNHPATQEISPEKIIVYGSDIIVQPYILPHHSKLTQEEYERYETDEGYTKSQGFYLYRANRLLIYGTWWGMHKTTDAHKLVRIKIDIPNNQDKLWGIDIKKSTAKPVPGIKNDLKRIIKQVTEKGSRPYTGRGRKIEDKTITQFWEIIPVNNHLRFALNHDHPLYIQLLEDLSLESAKLLDIYLKGLQAYLPLEAIQAKLQQSPHIIKQETALSEDEIKDLAEKIKSAGLDEDQLQSLLKTEMFKNRKELLIDV